MGISGAGSEAIGTVVRHRPACRARGLHRARGARGGQISRGDQREDLTRGSNLQPRRGFLAARISRKFTLLPWKVGTASP
jgi:hypothetical protein